MIPLSTPAGSEPAPSTPVELSAHQIERLQRASAWARFLGVAGFVVTALIALAIVVLTFSPLMHTPGIGNVTRAVTLVPLVLMLAGAAAGSMLIWNYGRYIASFLVHGEPSLPRAFRNLRHFFELWTLLLGLTTTAKIVTLLGRLF